MVRIAHPGGRTNKRVREASGRQAASRAVDALIAEVGQRSGEFPDYLANHLPMVLEAMARLGASPERLAEYAAFYTETHKVPFPPPATNVLDAAGWRAALGARSREADLRAFFAKEVDRLGQDKAVRTYVPKLLDGVAASATHGLMRLAYGLLRDDDSEVGIALGYWAATHLPLPGPDLRSPGRKHPVTLLLSMQVEPQFRQVEAGSTLLWRWIEAMGKLPAFRARSGRVAQDGNLLPTMREASLALYAGSMSFEALHAVTGCHWLRLVSPHLDEPEALAARFWDVVMSLYARIGMPDLPTEAQLDQWRRLDVPPDAEIAAAAAASDDEHDHSLVFSAFEEFTHTSDPLYRVVAARRVGLI